MRNNLTTFTPSLRALLMRAGDMFAMSRHDFHKLLTLRYGIGDVVCADTAEVGRELGLSCFIVRGLLRQVWQKIQKEMPDALMDPSRVIAYQLHAGHKLHIPLSTAGKHGWFDGMANPDVSLLHLIRDMASCADAVGPTFPRIIQIGGQPLATFIPEVLEGRLTVADLRPSPLPDSQPEWINRSSKSIARKSLGCIRQDFLMFSDALTEMHESRARACAMLACRIGIDTGEAMSLEEVGERYGVTRERARKSCEDAAHDILLLERKVGWGPVSAIMGALQTRYPEKLPAIIFLKDLPDLDGYFQAMKGNPRGLYNMMSAYSIKYLMRSHGMYINAMNIGKKHAVSILRSIESMERETMHAKRSDLPPPARMSVTVTDEVIALVKAAAERDGRTANDVYASILGEYLKAPWQATSRREVEWDKRGTGWRMVNILLPKEGKIGIAAAARGMKVSRSSLVDAIVATKLMTRPPHAMAA